MFTILPERGCRQKGKLGVFQDAGPDAFECFQISVNIVEAKNVSCTASLRTDSYVVVTLGKERHKTFLRRNTEENCREFYLLFEWHTSLMELQGSTLGLALMEPRRCAPPRLLGEANVDLGVIWAQPNHQVFHKWAQLSLPRNPGAGVVGFLKVDISIVCKGEIRDAPPTLATDRLGQSVVQSLSEQQTANYVVSVYGALGLVARRLETRHEKLPTTYVRVTFCGIAAKTAVQPRSSSPRYCEQISIAELFPNVCQTMRFEVCSTDQTMHPVLASVDLHLEQISHDGENGFVPTFGPSLLHMYGGAAGPEAPAGAGPFHRGALLVALRTLLPCAERALRTTSVEPTPAIQMDDLWTWEDFCIYCPILEVSMLNRHLANKRCGVAFTIGEIPCEPSNNEEFMSTTIEIKKRKLHYTGPMTVAKNTSPYGALHFANAFPVLQSTARLPAFRFRIYRNNFVQKISENFENSLQDVENRLNNFIFSYPSEILEDLVSAANHTADSILGFLEAAAGLQPGGRDRGDAAPYCTALDQKQFILQKEELEKIYHQMRQNINSNSDVNVMKLLCKTSSECYSISKKSVKRLLVELLVFSQKLKTLVFKSAEGWPDIVVWLLNEGSRTAYHKIPISDVIFSETPELCGKDCGRIQTVYLKPIKCPKHLNVAGNSCTCIAGKVELILWAGLFSEASSLESTLPDGLRVKTREYDVCLKAPIIMVKCRVFLLRAKLAVEDGAPPPSAFARVNVLNAVRDTQVHDKSLTPVWDQVLTVTSMVRASQGRMTESPPEVMVEIYHYDSPGKCELIGRATMRPVVMESITGEYAPPLQWHQVVAGLNPTGQVLMSAYIQQLPETLVKSTIYSSVNELDETSTSQDAFQDVEDNKIEEIPRSVKPRYSAYKVDVYWWGLRDTDAVRKPCAALEIDELTLKSDVIADQKTNCNFPNGRVSQTFLANFEHAYFSPLTVKLFVSTTFGRTIFFGTNAVKNPTKYLVDWMPKHERDSSLRSASISSSEFIRVNKTLFIKKSSTASDSAAASSKLTRGSSCSTAERKKRSASTWKRIFCRTENDEQEYILLPVNVERSSYKEIYDSELENQFDKFKDWCSVLKLYNGTKTGLPERDEELRCGALKVGIAIYRWPPPANTVVVNWRGVDLERGYFDDCPTNAESKYLVRAYVVRGLSLVHNGECNPYVMIKCGAKQSGSRNEFQENTVNPIFGRTYEVHCCLPDDYLLSVEVHSRDPSGADSLVGSTQIDLENRIYSKHRARVGLASEYNVTGSAKWRDCEKPSDILTKLCIKNHLLPPTFLDGNTVIVNDVEYRDADMTNKTYISASARKENLCLSLLNRWHTLPVCGCRLVPEHVETRSLLHPDHLSVEQGKILMWLDIFPLDMGGFMPLPVDITPRKVEDYELRVIVWHIQSLPRGRFSQKKRLDLYVKAWIGSAEQAHYTDVHYNSSRGEACFNWRMIFHFQYQHSEKKLVVKEQGPFTEYEERLPPVLVVQLADSDADSLDDYLASLALDLSAIPRGSRHVQACAANHVENMKKVNLFSARSIRSWWPLKTVDRNSGATKVQGMIDLELHLLPKSKAVIMPVGIGRDPPFPLPMPNRSDSSPLRSSLLETALRRAGVEHLVIALLLASLVVVWCWDLPSSLGNFVYYY